MSPFRGTGLKELAVEMADPFGDDVIDFQLDAQGAMRPAEARRARDFPAAGRS